MDKLSQLLQELSFNAEVFFSGNLCGIGFDENAKAGSLHLLKSGTMTLITEEGHELFLDKAAVIFIPSGSRHKIEIKETEGAEVVCASIHLQSQQKAQLTELLPKFIFINVDQCPTISDCTQWIFEEAFGEKDGRNLMIDRLCDVFMIQLLRYVATNGIVELGLFAGKTHPQLEALMKTLETDPAGEWTVESMAEYTAMSRSKFAALFKETVGQAPMDYLTDLRMAVAKGLLDKQKPVGLVANEVGYENASTLARIFKKRFGVTPKKWIKRNPRIE